MHPLKRLIYTLEQRHGKSVESRRTLNRLIGGTKRKRKGKSTTPKRHKNSSTSTQTTTEDHFASFASSECRMCFETLGKDLLILPCGHFFHSLCLAKWLKEKPDPNLECPVCRQSPADLLPKKQGNYIGQTKNKRPYGNGIGSVWHGVTYEGEWGALGRPHGKGTDTTADGKRYEGYFKHGYRHGKGTLTWPSGKKYVGEWKGGQINGKGTLTLPSGSKYEGEWKDGTMNGKGTFTWTSGKRKKYVGEWKDGKMNGKGTLTYSNGTKYIGKWKDGEKIRKD